MNSNELDKIINSDNLFASGEKKWIPKNLKNGRCTPLGNPRCPKGSPQYNLAVTFKKHHGFHADGGMLMADGGTLPNKKEDDGMMSFLTKKFGSMFEGTNFTEKMKKANELIPIVKMIPGGEKFLKDMAYKIGSQSKFAFRNSDDLNDISNLNEGTYSGTDTGDPNRDLLKLAIYGDDNGFFEKVPKEILSKSLIPLNKTSEESSYKNIPAYFANISDPETRLPYTSGLDSIPYNNIENTVKSLLNRNRLKKGLKEYSEPQLSHKADSVLTSITPSNSVIYSTGEPMTNPLYSQAEVVSPYYNSDNLAGYVARIRRDPNTKDLWYDQNDVWDFDKDYASRWGEKGSEDVKTAEEQAKALRSVTKPFRLIATNPVAKPKKKYYDGGNLNSYTEGMKDQGGELIDGYNTLLFLGGNVDPMSSKSASNMVWDTTDSVSNLMLGDKELDPGFSSGALKGIKSGKDMGALGMLSGAIIGGISAQKQQNKDIFAKGALDMKQRNQLLGIKSNGGNLILPLGVSPNMTSEYKDGGLVEFNAGGSHESNPFMGVGQGFDNQGNQNKVEQGETKWQDYIFSDRLKLDKNTIDMHNLPKSYEGKTFADVSKLMNKVAKERPNDIISKNTIKDHMNRLMLANDTTREAEESSIKSMGGNLYSWGDQLDTQDRFSLGQNKLRNATLDPLNILNKASEIKQMTPDEIKSESKTGKTPFFKDIKNLRYAPIAFDALVATGLFGKTPTPETYSPTLIQNQGQLTPEQIDEMQMRNATDAAYQTGVSGLSESAGGSGAALRAGLSGLNADYIGGIGKAYASSNQANIGQRQATNQFNLQNQQNVASQNAQLLSQADQYNNQLLNQNRLTNFNNRMDYLAKGAEGLGDIGYEQRMMEIFPKTTGYTTMGDWAAAINAMKNNNSAKACGGRLRMLNRRK